MGKYFGTDGFRGEANIGLTVEHAFKVGRYLGWYFGQEHKARIVIGKDTRRSSYMFEYALAAGLTASGADAYLLHVTTTPSVSYVTSTEDFDCIRWKQKWKTRSKPISMVRQKRFRWQQETGSDVRSTMRPEETVTSDT